jgi:hypothetical protein
MFARHFPLMKVIQNLGQFKATQRLAPAPTKLAGANPQRKFSLGFIVNIVPIVLSFTNVSQNESISSLYNPKNCRKVDIQVAIF